MRRPPTFLLALASSVLAAGSLFAQVEPAPAAPSVPAVPAADALQAKVEKAIADFEALRKDPKKQAQRNRALGWIGELDHELATDFLGKELGRAGDKAFAATVLQAIAMLPRPRLFDEVWQVLRRDTAPAAVRIAAAVAVAKLGERGVDRLLDLVRSGDDTITDELRDFATTSLLQHGGERAHRGLAPRLFAGKTPERLKLLRGLEAVRNVPAIDQARVKLAAEGEIELAAPAWLQLAKAGHDRARELTIDVFERLPEKVPPAVAADLIVGLCLVRDADFYPVVLRLGSDNAEPVRRALRTAAPFAGKDPGLVQFLIQKGLEDPKSAVRAVALVLLGEAPPQALQPLLAKVRVELKNPKKKALDLAIGLHDLLARAPSWRQDCQALALSKDPEVRTVGLALLLELGADTGIVPAQQSLGDKAWELRSIAYRYLTKFRDIASIPLLIARVEREDGRLGAELAQALFAHTGTRCWKRKEWDAWWAEHKNGFVLPHPDTVRGGSGSGGGQTVSYYDIPLVSSHVAFLIDRSGSMTARIGTDKKFTRLEAAKEQMRKVLEVLPKTHYCNLIVYESGVQAVWDTMRICDDPNREELLSRVKAIAPGGGTNIFDALEKAFQDPGVDTIYLLTDGEPSAGRLTGVDDIADEIRKQNRARQIVIHCIGLGIDSALLKRLAAESGGSYKYVQ